MLPGVGVGSGGVNGGGIGNPQTIWTLGIAPSISSTSYDACLKNFSVSAIAGGINIPLEISHCWELRDMDAMAKFPPGSIQYEHGCRDSSWLATDWASGTIACSANKQKLAKTAPSDPRAQPMAATPVVFASMNQPAVPNAPPPTVVPVNKTDRPVVQAPAVAPQPQVAAVTEGPACFNAKGDITGHVVNGACQ